MKTDGSTLQRTIPTVQFDAGVKPQQWRHERAYIEAPPGEGARGT